MIKSLKIAIYSGSIPSTTFIEHLINGVSQSHQVYLFGTLNKKINYNNENVKLYATYNSNLKNTVVNVYRMFLLMFRYPKRLFVLKKVISEQNGLFRKWVWLSKTLPIILYKPDILHVQWAKDIRSLYFMQEALNCPIVLSLLGSHINYSPIVDKDLAEGYRQIFPNILKFHAVSDRIAIESLKYGAKLENIVRINTPIEIKELLMRPVSFKEDSVIKILSVGRHHWVKGYEYSIRAMKLLKSQNINFKYSIIAQGRIPENILFLIKDLNLVDNVVLLSGIESQDLLFEEMKKQDIFLLPSLSEGIANVVLEAMVVGLPVISSDCGGMSEVILPNKTGFLVPARNAEAIANTIINIKQLDVNELSKIRDNAHELVKAQFNYNKSVEEFIKLYKNVIDENPVEK